jgi:hypothetical protein
MRGQPPVHPPTKSKFHFLSSHFDTPVTLPTHHSSYTKFLPPKPTLTNASSSAMHPSIRMSLSCTRHLPLRHPIPSQPPRFVLPPLSSRRSLSLSRSRSRFRSRSRSRSLSAAAAASSLLSLSDSSPVAVGLGVGGVVGGVVVVAVPVLTRQEQAELTLEVLLEQPGSQVGIAVAAAAGVVLPETEAGLFVVVLRYALQNWEAVLVSRGNCILRRQLSGLHLCVLVMGLTTGLKEWW